ncbi:MAG: hypothetical protein DIJKHBIC_03815 [Thermoanaerobaculia bacterium]|nr:hypothetical protein [Thermoanaerobaculia bacterium]
MKYILDPHTLLWFLSGDDKLSETSRAAIEDRENGVLVSVASLWEIAIKISLGNS